MLRYAVALLLMIPLVSASFISMTTTVNTVMEGDTALVTIETSNNGDESAYNVQATAELGDIKESSETKNIVGVKQSFSTNMSLDLSSLEKPGDYPLIVRVDYADANGYPFSAITHSIVSYQKSTSSDVFATLDDAAMSEDGGTSVRVRLRNRGEEPREVTVSLITPKEIAGESKKTVNIQGDSETETDFQVSSFGALAGSTYAVLAVVEYEDDYHYSSVARGIIEIKGKSNLLLDNWFLFTLLVALVAVVVLYQFKGLRWRFWKGKPSSVA